MPRHVVFKPHLPRHFVSLHLLPRRRTRAAASHDATRAAASHDAASSAAALRVCTFGAAGNCLFEESRLCWLPASSGQLSSLQLAAYSLSFQLSVSAWQPIRLLTYRSSPRPKTQLCMLVP